MHNRKLLNIELGRIKAEKYRDLPDTGIAVVLDNIRSAHNVGSAFRSSDSFKVDRIYLCGICAVPPSAEIHKSALGAEDSVPWEHWDDTAELVMHLKSEGYTVVSIEQAENWSGRCLGYLCRDSAVRHQAFPECVCRCRDSPLALLSSDTIGLQPVGRVECVFRGLRYIGEIPETSQFFQV